MKTELSTSASAETFSPASRAVRHAASAAPGQTAVDALSLAAVLSFARCGGARVLAERKDIPFRVFSAAASLWLILKGIVYFGYTVVFLMVDLFEAVPPYVVIIVLALPVLRSVARCAELFAPVLFLLVLFNLALLETDLDFGRNLPLAAMPSEDFFARGLTFGMWLGDLIPLAFAEVKRRRKFPALPVGAGVSYALVAVIAMLAVAMYGAALPYAYNMLIRIAGFNKLSLEIGRMEWAAIFVVIVMAVLALSLHFWGAREGCRLATGSSLPASLLFAAGIIVIPLAIPALQDVIAFSTTEFGYAAFAVSVALSLSAGLLALRAPCAQNACSQKSRVRSPRHRARPRRPLRPTLRTDAPKTRRPPMSERPALRAAKARLRDKFFRTKWLVALIAAAILLW